MALGRCNDPAKLPSGGCTKREGATHGLDAELVALHPLLAGALPRQVWYSSLEQRQPCSTTPLMITSPQVWPAPQQKGSPTVPGHQAAAVVVYEGVQGEALHTNQLAPAACTRHEAARILPCCTSLHLAAELLARLLKTN